MSNINEFNPARKKRKTPFLRKGLRPPPSATPQKIIPSALHSTIIDYHNCTNLESLQQLSARTAQKLNQVLLGPSIDRELLRKKSSLILLNLRYIDLQEKYTSLLEKTQNHTISTDPDCQQLSNISQKRSHSSQKRLQKLQTIKKRLAKITVPPFFPLPLPLPRASKSTE